MHRLEGLSKVTRDAVLEFNWGRYVVEIFVRFEVSLHICSQLNFNVVG